MRDYPCVFGYGRASTGKQVITLSQQKEVIMAQYELKKKTGRYPDNVQWGGWYADSSTSGRTEWMNRPMGEKMFFNCQPGDYIIITKVDRAFRGFIDACVTIENLLRQEIYVHILDMNNDQLDLSTPLGKLIFRITCAYAELEADQTSQRTSDALQHKKKKHLPTGGAVPLGYKKVGDKINSRFVPDLEERKVIQKIADYIDNQGMTLDDVTRQLRMENIKVSQYQPKRVRCKHWTRGRIYNAYKAYYDGYPVYGEKFNPSAHAF